MIHWTRQIKEVLSSQDMFEAAENSGYLYLKLNGKHAKNEQQPHLASVWCYNEIREFKWPWRDGGAEDNVDWKINLYFIYEFRDTLKSFTSFISAKAVTKLNLGHIDKSEIKI